ncbi:MAG: PAS domain-containing protein [Verrucomicrobia bacterium]|nr:PAS domain-containing protein [Verrucomicrobiota bacterium]
MKSSEPSASHTGLAFLLVFLLLVSGIVMTGVFYYRHLEQQFRAKVEQQVSAIAELKVSELVQWRNERLGDANAFYDNPAFSILVRRFFQKPEDTEARRLLQRWMSRIQTNLNYRQVVLTDTQGVLRLSAPEASPMAVPYLVKDAAAFLDSGKLTFLDLHRDTGDAPPHMAVMIPVFDDQAGRRSLGVVALLIDPETYFYPFIKRWPLPSLTGETLLVRRESNEVIFLNELRFQNNAALNLRVPLDRATMPAVQAVLGREGVMEGEDYRGVPVVAALRTIPDSPWSLVARMDIAEVYAPLRAQLWRVVVVIGALIFGAGACVVLAWRHQRIRFYRERAAAAEKLQESESKLIETQKMAQLGHWSWDVKTGAVEWSEEVYNIFQLDPEKFTPHINSILELSPWPEDHTRDKELIQKAMTSHKKGAYDQRFLRPDGSIGYYHSTFQGKYDGDGQLVSIVGTVMDITARKRVEEALQQTAVELQEKNAELERFLYTASHDLKSPVVTVRTFLGYMEQDMAAGDAGRIEKDMRFIRAATDKMARLLDELLKISRIGRVVSLPVRVTFRNLVDEVLGAVAGYVAERGVTVKVGEHDVALYGDRLRLAEVWQNLVENACKFMGNQKEPRIEIGVEARGVETVFFVRDNGMGIDPRYHAKIFNLFEKLDPKAEGTGLGLALVKRIVELHQGRIWVESTGQGQGTSFYFTLPRAIHNPEKGRKT